MLDILYEKFGKEDYSFTVIEISNIKLLSTVQVTCNKHHSTTKDLLINLLHKAYPCLDCLIGAEDGDTKMMERGKRKKRNLEELILEFEEKHNDRFLYHDLPYSYKNMGTKAWIKCKKHNLFFLQTPNNHLNTEICCPKCQEEFRESLNTHGT